MEFAEKFKILKSKRSEIQRLNSDLIQFSSGMFEEFYQYIFDKYSELNSFGWTQYTPYFNDGESCLFYANTDYLIINDEYAEDSDWFHTKRITSWGQWNQETMVYEGRIEEENDNYNEILVDAYTEITDFLSNFDNDFYLNKFGDHAEITITKEGVNISDYDHE